MPFTEEVILDLESQAKIALSDAERARYMRDMQLLLNEVDRIHELDTTGVEPLVHLSTRSNVFRADAVLPSVNRAVLLAGAPRQKDGCFQVPKTVE